MSEAAVLQLQPQLQEQMKPIAMIEESEPTPETEKRYKCHTCHTFFYERELIGIGDNRVCPVCGENVKHLQIMCKLDGNGCHHEVVSGIKYCPECHMPICPECVQNGKITHDVVQISRVKRV